MAGWQLIPIWNLLFVKEGEPDTNEYGENPKDRNGCKANRQEAVLNQIKRNHNFYSYGTRLS